MIDLSEFEGLDDEYDFYEYPGPTGPRTGAKFLAVVGPWDDGSELYVLHAATDEYVLEPVRLDVPPG